MPLSHHLTFGEPGFSRVYTRCWFLLLYFMFNPIFGEMIQFDEHIFRMGWFNYQLGRIFRILLLGSTLSGAG